MHKDVAFPNSPHGRFLLVAGPSGGGKSTFIRALTEGRLDASILAALPEGCARWRVVEANDILKNRIKAAPSMDSASTDAAIYHYDIAFIHRFAISAYEQDPFCSTLKDAPLLDIIYVRPDLTSLLKQYRLRRQNNRAARSWLRRFWHYSVRQPLKRIKLRKNGLPAIDADDLYCLPGFLSSCYRGWERFLDDVANANPQSRLLVVRPQTDPSGNPTFVIDRRKLS